MGNKTKRDALARLKVAHCAAQRLGDLHTVISQETYALAGLGVSTAELSTAAEHVDSARLAAHEIARECEATLLGGKAVKS